MTTVPPLSSTWGGMDVPYVVDPTYTATNNSANLSASMAAAAAAQNQAMVNAANASDIAQPNSQEGTNKLSGFAARYTPMGLESTIWDNPWAILPDVFQGINTAGGGYNALRNLNADPLTLYNIMQGRASSLTGDGTSVGDYANWLAALYQSLGTKGGRAFSAKELLGNIFNPGADGSALKNILTAGDASQQMRTLFNLVKDATNVGMNPLAARGYQAALSRAGDTYLNQAMKTTPDSGVNNVAAYQALAQLAPGLIPR